MEEWDSIDWDEKVEELNKSRQKKKQEEEESNSNISYQKFEDDDGNYFNEIEEKKKQIGHSSKNKSDVVSKTRKSKNDIVFQPYSSKDLSRIRNYTTKASDYHLLFNETFGNERFLLTHQQQELTNESIVDLLKIDVALLSIPFDSHNRLLLESIAHISSFWSQMLSFIRIFLERKHKDLGFLLVVDMNGFFDDLELLLHNIIISNLFNSDVELFFEMTLQSMEEFKDSEWNNSEKLQRLKVEYQKNAEVFKIYEIYPTIYDLKVSNDNLSANILKGEYEDVSQYLQVQLPLLKEDFISKLRDGCSQLKLMTLANKIEKTSNVWIHPKVQIVTVLRNIWEMDCRLIVLRLSDKSINFKRRFFNGQMLCFTSSTSLDDLVVAVVLRRNTSELQITELIIEVIKTENIVNSNIFNKDFIMIEPTTFFEPYHRVFNVMKSLNEMNFPFSEQILKVRKSKKIANYRRPLRYKGFTFDVENINQWPATEQLSLELMQLKAIQKAVTSQFTVIQGPPGCGKTFCGLEILKILLENTTETILVLTQTNNALDKFLLGASEFTSDIARLGGQYCEELERFVYNSFTTLESKRYLRKLQIQHKEEIAQLMKSNVNNEEIHRKTSMHYRLIDEINQLNSFYRISQIRIVGMTTTFAARNVSVNKMLKPGIVIIEEASEVLESHVLVSLTKETKQIIMIGDHQQLRPQTNSYNLAKTKNFNISLFERLIANDFDFICLDVQMRMNSEICDLIRGTIYSELKDGQNVKSLPMVKGMSHNFYCVTHDEPESVGDGETSKENAFECEYVVQLCCNLIKNGNKANQITILTPYAAQSERIKKRCNDFPECSAEVKVAVLDAFQGDESDIILLSLVRSNRKRDIGFLANENRIAVLLSRAKFGFYIIANMDCLASASGIWRKIRTILEEKDIIGDQIPDCEIFI